MTLLRHAHTILASLAAAERDLTGTVPQTELVRLGAVLSAGSAILPRALAHLAEADPQITVTTREGTTPSLIRALRAGSLDLAVLTSRPPHRPFDSELPRLHLEAVADTELAVAVPSTGEFAGRTTAHVDELVDAAWIATSSSNSEPLLGVWPGLPGRPRVVHSARDWLTKLQLVAGGFGVTTVPSRLSPVLPPGVSLLRVEGAPPRSAGCSWHASPATPPRRSPPSPKRSPRPPEPPPRPHTIACTPFPPHEWGHRGHRRPVLRGTGDRLRRRHGPARTFRAPRPRITAAGRRPSADVSGGHAQRGTGRGLVSDPHQNPLKPPP